MRIAVVSRGWWPSIKGGSEKFTTRVAEELAKRGHEVVGVTRWIRGFPEPSASHELVVLREDRAWPLLSSYRFSRWAARVVNELGVDVVLVNSYWGEMAPLYIRRPCVAVVHDVGLFSSRVSGGWLKNLLRGWVLGRVVRRVERVVVPTEAVRNDLVRYLGVDPGKIRVLGFEGVDGPFREVRVENGWFDVVQVGRFAPNKGQHVLLEAFRRVAREVRDARLWLVGGRSPGHLDYLNRVLELARKVEGEVGEGRVRVVVDAPDVGEYYALADVCVFPSLGEEGYGLTVVEAMAHGKPVVCSDVFAETGVAAPDRALIVRRGDAEELANAIVRLYWDEELRRTLSRRGLEYAKQCSWERVAERIEGVLLEVVEEL